MTTITFKNETAMDIYRDAVSESFGAMNTDPEWDRLAELLAGATVGEAVTLPEDLVYFARVVLDGGLDAYRGDGDDTWSYSDIEIN